MKRRTLEIGISASAPVADGEPGPPHRDNEQRDQGNAEICFDSIRSVAQILSPENQALLRLIMDERPQSLAELEHLSRRKKSNLSRTLRTLEKHGIVELSKRKGKLVPHVRATRFRVEFGFDGRSGRRTKKNHRHDLGWVCY